MFAIYVQNGEADTMYYVQKDYLGSFYCITDENGNIVENNHGETQVYNFDPWGRRRNPQDWTYYHVPKYIFDRGFTGHQHMDAFKLINMNGRVYDPRIGRFLSPDNFVQAPEYSQNFNPYSYALNNPLIYTDPSGDLWIPFVIGAIMGGYTGYKIADAKGYDLGDWQTYGYMLGGALIGGVSGFVGAEIAAAGGFLANTSSIVFSSYFASVGFSGLSGGMIQPSVSFGGASYNFGTGEWGYVGNPDNSTLENIGYIFGALANLQDVFTSFSPGDYQYQYETSKGSKVGHGNIREVKIDAKGNVFTEVKISVANKNPIRTKHSGILRALEYAWKSNFKKYSGGPDYWIDVPENGWPRIPLKLNSKIIDWMSNNLKNDMGLWGISRTRFGLNFGCVSYSARALWTAGVPTIPIINYLGPKVLWFQLTIRQIGIYSSPYIYNGF